MYYRVRRTCEGRCPVQSDALILHSRIAFENRLITGFNAADAVYGKAEALLQTGHLPTQVRRIEGYLKPWDASLPNVIRQSIGRERADPTIFLKMNDIDTVVVLLLYWFMFTMDCRIKFGNDEIAFQTA